MNVTTTIVPTHVALAKEAADAQAALTKALAYRESLTTATYAAIYLKLKEIFAAGVDRIVLNTPVSLGYGPSDKVLYMAEFERKYEYYVPASGGYDSYGYEAYRNEPQGHTMHKKGYSAVTAEDVLNWRNQDNMGTVINYHTGGKVEHQNQIDGQEYWTLSGALANVLKELEAGNFTAHPFREYVIQCACGHVLTSEEADDHADCPECEMSREDLDAFNEREANRDMTGYGSSHNEW